MIHKTALQCKSVIIFKCEIHELAPGEIRTKQNILFWPIRVKMSMT